MSGFELRPSDCVPTKKAGESVTMILVKEKGKRRACQDFNSDRQPHEPKFSNLRLDCRVPLAAVRRYVLARFAQGVFWWASSVIVKLENKTRAAEYS